MNREFSYRVQIIYFSIAIISFAIYSSTFLLSYLRSIKHPELDFASSNLGFNIYFRWPLYLLSLILAFYTLVKSSSNWSRWKNKTLRLITIGLSSIVIFEYFRSSI
jgi:E3 ubiquitin-protein ligase DOA10